MPKKNKDIHVVRYFSSVIKISDGKVINVTRPAIKHCPLASFMYKGLKNSSTHTIEKLKKEIKAVIEGKIAQYGFCSKSRVLWDDTVSIPYGASEIISYGLRSNIIDGSVIVCDGAGSIVTSIPQVVQGVGARMHGVIKTSAIPEVTAKLRRYGTIVLDDDGSIDQRRGIAMAAKAGYKNIAVTISAYHGEDLKTIRALARELKISVIILAVCTTGIKISRMIELEKYADIVWACHSGEIKKRLDKKCIRKASVSSAVYVLTGAGSDLMRGYSPNVFAMRKRSITRRCSFHGK